MEQKAPRSIIDDTYRGLPSISIDNGVMERSDKAAMVPVAFKWSDVGSWGSLDEVAAKDRLATSLAAGSSISGASGPWSMETGASWRRSG
jgi:mannose-1-phosphate guanylyltransferase